jgi:indolepyruvate ferredoxin oxidoreductase
VLILGYAWQKGLVPVSLKAMLRAIELNGVEVERNKQAFGWGRIAAADPRFLEISMGETSGNAEQPETLDALIERRAKFLVDYQDDALAAKFRGLVDRVRVAEDRFGTEGNPLTEAVARAYFKTLAYKDEYEVARLHTQSGFLSKLNDEYGSQVKFRFHLAPPMMGGKLDARGRPRKKEFGPWIVPLFRLLAAMRRLRGTKLDVFGMTAERRMERELIAEFERTVDTLLQSLSTHNAEAAAAIVNRYLDIRGYGPVKEQAAVTVRRDVEQRLAMLFEVSDIAA